MCDSGEPPLSKKDVCKAFHVEKTSVRAEDAKRLGVPLFFTEFGACSNTESCYHEITGAAEEFDNHLASWAYWMFKGFGDFTTTGSMTEGMYDKDGNLQHYKILALQRSYLHAIQGTPTSMYFFTDSDKNSTFIANFTIDTSIDAPTELFFNQDVYYPEGYKLSLMVNGAPSLSMTVDDSQKNYLKIKETNKAQNGKTATVVLTRKEVIGGTYYKDKSIKVDYTVEDIKDKRLTSVVYFKIDGVDKLPGETSFTLKGVDGRVFCKSNKNHHECFTTSHNAHSVTLEVV